MFLNAVKAGFARILDFRGRSRRPAFWLFALFVGLASLGLALADRVVFGIGLEAGAARTPLVGVLQATLLVPLAAAAWRRMHDTGRSGWPLLLPLAIWAAAVAVLFGGGVLLERQGLGGGAAQTSGALGTWIAGGLVAAATALLAWLLARPSEPGANAYGPPPGRP